MGKENVVNAHRGALHSHEEEWNPVTYRRMDTSRDHNVGQNKPGSGKQILPIVPDMGDLEQMMRK